MSITMEDYRCKLINKILFAASQSEVKRFIDGAMKGLKRHKVNGHIIVRFIDKVLRHLDELNTRDHEAQQFINIKMAKMQFNQIKDSIQA